MNGPYIAYSNNNKKTLYFLEQNIFEKANIYSSTQTLYSLSEVAYIGLVDPGLAVVWE